MGRAVGLLMLHSVETGRGSFRHLIRMLSRPAVRIAAAAGLAMLFLSMLTLQESELRRERAGYNYLLTTNNWALSQLEFEVERFLGALDRFMLGVPDMDSNALTLRFDILWSRIPVLMLAEETAEVRTIDGAVELLEDFEAALNEIERDLLALTPNDRSRYDRIRSSVTAWGPAIRTLTMEVYNGQHFQRLAERTREGYRRAALYQWAMLVVVTILSLFLGFEVLRSGRRTRDEKAARRAAEAANLAKSTFLATMSHELRTPLNAIMGFSEAQAKQLLGPVPSRYRDYANDIHTSASHLLAVLNDILDMARMDARRLTLYEEEFNPSKAVDMAVRMIDPDRKRAGIVLSIENRAMGSTLRADERLLRQIVLNLLSNAVKFTSPGGTVTVALDQSASGLTLSVRDTGTGISPDLLKRVAEPFFQADQSYARRHQGTGLGLSLVKGFAELHGGSIAIESTLGEGTMVAVRFPAARVGKSADTVDGSAALRADRAQS
jgi:signal transduction histidine kinase